ncbi:MAG TPA: ABC transporter ATP-binding protein [Acidimicrobiia bacterium]|nr:ABC transporter ATP-binding protein [Acidimicrobiia bacterium]
MTDKDAQPAIRMRHVERSFGDTPALAGMDLDVPEGRLMTLLGPSGSGKTTALRLIAGFDSPDRGSIEIGGRTVVGPGVFVPPERRRVGMVFQDYALFPHLTVGRNAGYGVPKRLRATRVAEVLELVGLAGKQDRLPHELSGGEQQRVALARALAPDPGVILLDEPFSNLDAALRSRVRTEVAEILRRSGTTAIFVTHDQEEALSMSDLVAVLRDGRVIQTGTPSELYHRPADPWVGSFLGDADFLTGRAGGGSVSTPAGTFASAHHGVVTVMIRPESVTLRPDADGDGVITRREFFGHDQLVSVGLPDGTVLRARLGPAPLLQPGDHVEVSVEEAATFPVPGSN